MIFCLKLEYKIRDIRYYSLTRFDRSQEGLSPFLKIYLEVSVCMSGGNAKESSLQFGWYDEGFILKKELYLSF